jgi:hypothetical protein
VLNLISWHEKDIEDYVCAYPHRVFGHEFYVIGRQINIGVGIIDVLLYNSKEKILYVVEIKNQDICNNALCQVMRYMQGVTDYLIDGIDLISGYEISDIKGLLMGPGIKDDTSSALRYVNRRIVFYQTKVTIFVGAEEATYSRNKENESYNPKPFNSLLKERLDELHDDAQEDLMLMQPDNETVEEPVEEVEEGGGVQTDSS